MNVRTGNLERNEQGRRMLERRSTLDSVDPLDELHRELGERLSAGLMGLLDLLSGAHRSEAIDKAAVTLVVKQAVTDELAIMRNELAELRRQLDEVRAGIQRIDRFTMQRVLGLDTTSEVQNVTAAPPTPTPTIHPSTLNQVEPKTIRAARAVVAERVFTTARSLASSGQNITQMAATTLAREAGVKPAQFTYAFKNRENFLAQFNQWLKAQRTA